MSEGLLDARGNAEVDERRLLHLLQLVHVDREL
jgi:hypothetical protein